MELGLSSVEDVYSASVYYLGINLFPALENKRRSGLNC